MVQELSLDQISTIKAKADEIKKAKKLKKVYPIYVFGEEGDEKELYLGYFGTPNIVTFSKFLSNSKKDEVTAIRQLARDTFLEGDNELVEDEGLFLYGLMGQIQNIVAQREGGIVNL